MLIGHQRIWNCLVQSAQNNHLAHAYLFVGQPEIGKKTIALEFAKWLLCQNRQKLTACGQCRSCQDIVKNQHPDVFILSPKQEEKKAVIKTFEIGIDEIKILQRHLSFSPYDSPYKIAIIDEVEWLTREAANSFLKTLEEPSSKSLIILVSSARQAILPTIISRCRLINFLPVAEKEILEKLKKEARSENILRRAVKLSFGRPGRAIKIINDKEWLAEQKNNINNLTKLLGADLAVRWEAAKQLSQNIPAAREILDQWILWLRDRIFESSGCENLMTGESLSKIGGSEKIKYSRNSVLSLIREIQKTQIILENSSFNAKLALEVLMLKI